MTHPHCFLNDLELSFLAGLELGYCLFQLLQSLLENASRGCNVQSHEALTARTEHFTIIQRQVRLVDE